MLTGIQSSSAFDDLYAAIFPKITYGDLPELVRLSRLLQKQYDATQDAIEDAQRTPAPQTGSPAMPFQPYSYDYMQHQLEQMNAAENALDAKLPVVGAAIVAAMSLHPSGVAVDLSNASLFATSLAGFDFGTAMLTNTRFDHCNLNGADLLEIRSNGFANSQWLATVWWNAKRLSRPLLDYLTKYYAFDPTMQYPTDTPAFLRAYRTAIRSLAR